MEEVWKEVIGYDGKYLINRYGLIYNTHTKHILHGGRDSDGYVVVALVKDTVLKAYRRCRLVGIHWIPNPENKRTINHKYGIKHDDFYLNLEWATHKEQINHADKMNLMNRGSEKQSAAARINGRYSARKIAAFDSKTKQKLWESDSISAACKKYNLDLKCVSSLVQGKKEIKSHKGMYFMPI